MTAPRRIQRQRAAGWRMPENATYVGRPTKWGNPWLVVPITDHHFPFGAAADVLNGDVSAGRFERWTRSPKTGAPYWATRMYERHLAEHPDLRTQAVELAGRDLACWCPLDQPCHADVLLRLAGGLGGAS